MREGGRGGGRVYIAGGECREEMLSRERGGERVGGGGVREGQERQIEKENMRGCIHQK
jgi:hypothetical protein